MSEYTGQLPDLPASSSSTVLPTSPSPVTGTSYVARAITITITLGQGTFGQTGFNTVTLSNLRCAVTIEKAGFPSQDTTTIQVYGAPPSVMNQVSTLGINQIVQSRIANTVSVQAGDAVNGMSVVYNGYITNSYQDPSGAPETFLQITAIGGYLPAMQPATPSSFPAGGNVADMMNVVAGKLGWTLENNGVQVILPPSYFPGTLLHQLHAMARAANIEMYQDTTTNPTTLAIWSKNMTRANGLIPLINAQSGLINYPRFSSQGTAFQCLFNPNLRLGRMVQLESDFGGPAPPVGANAPPAGTPQPTGPITHGGPNGTWIVSKLSYDLTAQIAGGPWFCDVECAMALLPQ